MMIQEAKIFDLRDILSLQKLAYSSEAKIYNDFSIPPLVQTLEEIKDEFKSHTFLKAVENWRIIGSVRASLMDPETCYIGRLIVHPDFQNQGIGTRLMKEIENIFRDCKRFEIMTGYKSEKNIKLYEKLGYCVFKTEKFNDNLNFVYLEK